MTYDPNPNPDLVDEHPDDDQSAAPAAEEVTTATEPSDEAHPDDPYGRPAAETGGPPPATT